MSFSYDGQLIAAAAEDKLIDVSHVESGELICQVPSQEGAFSVAWHPLVTVLAFSGEAKGNSHPGLVSIFGAPKGKK